MNTTEVTIPMTSFAERGKSRFAHPAVPALTSAIVALVLYAITLGGTYIYDDNSIVHDDPRVREPSQWGKLWTTGYNTGADNLYRPLVSMSYAVEWYLHGDRPWVFHLVNVLLNAGVAAAVAELTRRGLCNSPAPSTAACIAGWMFAAHPLHVEAVANIVGRAELACAIIVLGSLVILAGRPLTMRRAIAALFCGIAAMLCKEQGILSPLLWMMLGLFRWRDRELDPGERRVIRTLVLLTLWIWAAYLIGREHFLKFEWDITAIDPTMQPLVHSIGIDRALMPVVLIGHYAALFFWPAHLSLDYGGDVIGSHAHFADPYLWFGFIAIAGWCLALVAAWIRRSGFIVFSLMAMAVTYGVVGNIVTLIGTNFAERLMYLPSAFLLMAIAAAVATLPIRLRIVLFTIAFVPASLKSFTAARDWNHPLQLYQQSLVAAPKSIQAHLLLAEEYRRQGDPTAADAVLDQACDQYPGYWRVWMFRANAAIDDRDLPTARRDLKRAIRLEANPQLLGVETRLEKLEAEVKTEPPTK